MSEFTTIQITKSLRDKLDLVKGENNLTYNQIVEKLLQQSGGVIVEDTVEVGREQVALSLKYLDNSANTKIRDVTFRELASASVGDVFSVVDNPLSANDWVMSKAKVMAKENADVILLVEEISDDAGRVSSIKSVVHVALF